MTYPVSTLSYTQGTGVTSNSIFITIFMNRAPTTDDINYPVTKRWVNTVTFKEYILTGFNTQNGFSQAIWINLTNGTTSGLDELTGNTGGTIQPDTNSNINLLGDGTSIRIDGTPINNTLTALVILPVSLDVVLIGNGTSISSVANSTEGDVLTCHTSGPPTFEPITSNFTWSTQTTNFSSVAGNGYFIVGTNIVGSTPESANLGDTIKFICNTATFQLTCDVTIAIGNQSGSTLNNTSIGDTLSLVFDGNGTWWAQDAPQGIWQAI